MRRRRVDTLRLRALALAAAALIIGLTGWPAAGMAGEPSPITQIHLQRVNDSFRANGIRAGHVAQDRFGRLELQGAYENEREVDRAFSLAQTIVGVRWVSPITPQNIKVKEWEECLSNMLAGAACGPSAAAPPPAARPGVPAVEVPPGPIRSKYALVVGVGKFQYGITPLQYANKDAYDFYSYLVDPAGGNFPRENVILLRDEYAVRDNVKRGLDAIRQRAGEDDFVLLFFSSHGTPPDKYGGVHLVTYDANVKPRERIWETSVTETILREFVQEVRAKRLVVVLDACYSNGAYSQVAGFLPPGGKSLGADTDEGYGRSRQDMARRLFGAKDLVVDDEPVASRPKAVQSGGGWGKVLISASDAGERSWESDSLRNSVFTRHFIDGLRQSGGAVQNAFEYAKARVPAQVKQEKGADITQNPQITTNRREWNMALGAPGR
jgi:uncharacterized caspase-like protein